LNYFINFCAPRYERKRLQARKEKEARLEAVRTAQRRLMEQRERMKLLQEQEKNSADVKVRFILFLTSDS
jgi:hypothetical protein